MLLITFRPEFEAPWADRPHVTALIAPSARSEEAAELVRGLRAEQRALPDELVAEIVERTDGVPLFLEELTKAVVEAGTDRAGGILRDPACGSCRAGHAPRLAHDPARPPGPAARQLAQVGAVIGREFSHELLAAVAGPGGRR